MEPRIETNAPGTTPGRSCGGSERPLRLRDVNCRLARACREDAFSGLPDSYLIRGLWAADTTPNGTDNRRLPGTETPNPAPERYLSAR